MALPPSVRQTLIAADRLAMGGRGLLRYRASAGKRLQNRILRESCFTHFAMHYPTRTCSSFAALCDKYGSDKGTRSPGPHAYSHPPHSYADFYAMLFDHCRLSIRKIFECGLGTTNPSIASNMGVTGRPGASLRAWRDYFPHAVIYGADIDRTILFTEDRIATFELDQTNPASIAALWRNPDLRDFDLIVDDGLHTFEAAISLFEHSHDRLRSGGIYVVEDVTLPTLEQLVRYFASRPWQVGYVTFSPKQPGEQESSLFIVRAEDPRP